MNGAGATTTQETDEQRRKRLGLPQITPNVVPQTTDFLGTVQRFTQPTVTPGAQPAVAGAAQAVQQALAAPPGQLAQQREAAESARLAAQEATEKQQMQDILGRTRLAGTARGIERMGEFVTGLGERRAQELGRVRTEAEQEEQRRREAAVQQAIGLGGLGVQERGLGVEAALGGARIESAQQMQLREFGQAEKILGIEQAFTGTQADLDRQLTQQVEAGRISQQEADRASREWAVRQEIASSERLATMNIGWQREMQELNATLSREGWDRDAALQATRIQYETARDTLDRELQQDQMALQASQFDNEMDFRRWAEQNRVQEAEATRAWQTAENAMDRAITEGELALKGKQLGLESDRLDLMRQEVMGKLDIATEELRIAQQAQDTATQTTKWQQILQYSELLPTDQAAALIAETAENIGMDVPRPVTRDEAQNYLRAAGGDPERAAGLAMNEGKIFIGTDGVTASAPGQTRSNPLDGSTATRLGGADVAFFDETRQDWIRPAVGSYVNFTAPVNAPELPYGALPADTYQVLTGQDIINKGIGTMEDLSAGFEPGQRPVAGFEGARYFVGTGGNIFIAGMG